MPLRIRESCLLLAMACATALAAAGVRAVGPSGGATRQTASSADAPSPELLARARALHTRIVTIDSHSGFKGDPARPCGATDTQVDFPKMRQGGLDAVFFAVWVPQRRRTEQTYAEARRLAELRFQRLHDVVRRCADAVGLARTPDDVERIIRAGKLAVAIGMENGFMVGRDLSLLRTYRDLGAAYLGLVHDGHNDLADSAAPSEQLGDAPAKHGGVSVLGQQVIAEMNRLGIVVDVSHMSKAARVEAIRLSRVPVIDSHSSMRALVDDPRNVDDETLANLARRGGVVQVTAVPFFIKHEPPEVAAEGIALFREFGVETITDANRLPRDRRAEFQRRYARLRARWPLPGVATLVDHIDHAVKVAGIDHVGIGSDFEGGGQLADWADASQTMNITVELLRRGYSDTAIEKIWGGNLLRVWREAHRFSQG